MPTETSISSLTEIQPLVQELLEILENDYSKWTSRIKTYQENIKRLVSDRKNQEKLLKDLSEIILHLQYHDIIGQKLDHIVEINEFVTTIDLGDYTTPFKGKIAEMLELSFNNIEKEYLTSAEVVRSRLTTLSENEWPDGVFQLNNDNIFEGCPRFLEAHIEISKILGRRPVSQHDFEWHQSQFIPALNTVSEKFSMKSEREIFCSVFQLGPYDESTLDVDLF